MSMSTTQSFIQNDSKDEVGCTKIIAVPAGNSSRAPRPVLRDVSLRQSSQSHS